eukprot:9341360-Lingulodinium_polyedra.AAC.1
MAALAGGDAGWPPRAPCGCLRRRAQLCRKTGRATHTLLPSASRRCGAPAALSQPLDDAMRRQFQDFH